MPFDSPFPQLAAIQAQQNPVESGLQAAGQVAKLMQMRQQQQQQQWENQQFLKLQAQQDQEKRQVLAFKVGSEFDKADTDESIEATRQRMLAGGIAPPLVEAEAKARKSELMSEKLAKGYTPFQPQPVSVAPPQTGFPSSLPTLQGQTMPPPYAIQAGGKTLVPPSKFEIQAPTATAPGGVWEQPGGVGRPQFQPSGQMPATGGGGLLGEMIQAQNLLTSETATPQQKDAARSFMQKQEGGNFKATLAEIKNLRTPEERIDYLQQNDPGMLDYIKGIRDGRVPVTGFSQFSNDIRDLVTRLYPNTNFGKVAFYQRAWGSYGDMNGRFQQNVLSLNTVAAHLGSLKDTIENLNIGDQPIPNGFDLMAKQITGDPTVTAKNMTELAVTLETHRALSGVGITDQEMQRYNSILGDKFFGKKQALQFVKSIGHLVDQRFKASEQEVSTVLGPEALEQIPVRRPDAVASLSGILNDGKKLDVDTARQFLQQAGGDKDKARQLARDAGYTF